MRISNILLSLPKTLLSSVIATLIFFQSYFILMMDGQTIDIFGALYLDTSMYYLELCG